MEITSTMTFFQYLHHVDKDITLAINSIHCPFTDHIWQILSNLQIWYVLYIAVAVAMFIKLGWKKALIVILSVVLTIVACDQFANFIKGIVQRLRPCYDLDMVAGGLNILEQKGGLYGFFSAHSANAMGFAIASWRGFKLNGKGSCRIYGTAIIVWALLVGISRIFVGKHFFGDVCVGFAIGLLFGWIISYVTAKVCSKLK